MGKVELPNGKTISPSGSSKTLKHRGKTPGTEQLAEFVNNPVPMVGSGSGVWNPSPEKFPTKSSHRQGR